MNRSHCPNTLCAVLLLAGFVVPATAAAEPFRVQGTIPFAEENRIARNITSECTELGVKLSDFLVRFAKKKGIEVKQVGELNPADPGRNLVIEITDAVSRGNAFIGHQKYMEARAELFVDGESKGEQFYHRDSMGGFGAGYKSSCAVLGRTSKALGKDFSVWLQELETAGL